MSPMADAPGGIDMDYVMTQGTSFAKWAERMAGKQRHGDDWRETANNWRAMRWQRLDKEIEWAKAHGWQT